jgi:7-cyano-7-deazaguanine synthase
MKPIHAVVALSGGLDSCVTTAIAAEKYTLCLLHISYGQKTENREKKAFNDIADFYNVPVTSRVMVAAPHIGTFGGSSLTDPRMPIPTGPPRRGVIPNTYVPFRNAFILSVATAWAEALGGGAVFIGVTEPDSSGYPDCRPGFIRTFADLVKAGTRPETEITIQAPLIALHKHHIVKKGVEIAAPLHLSWSCYRNSGSVACGRCESCLLRLKGFREAGYTDPVPYESTHG